jgi:type I restriction enzyme, S subunit
MSRIDEMIARLAPHGVEHVELHKVAGYSDTRVDASELDSANFVGVDNLVSNKAGKVDATYLPNTARLTAYEEDDILIGNIRPYLKKIWRATNAGGCSGDVLAVRINASSEHSLTPEFLYYVLSSDDFFAYNMQHAKGAKMPRGDKEAILKYHVPLPPVEVQREIVRVLDSFTELEAELEAELKVRQLQYAYYRDRLFAFPGAKDVQRVPMGELGKFIRGRRFTKDDVVDDGIPSIHYGEIYTHYGVATTSTVSHVRRELADQLRYAQPADVVIAAVGETVEDVAKAVAWMGDEPVAIHDDTFLFRSEINPKFVAYYMQSVEFHSQKNKHVARAKVKRLSGGGLAKISIPVPSPGEQERVVGILDRFDTLVNDLSVGLPAELNARRKQYEYYRNRLLTFEELAA